jgi:hypothetical protein
MSRTYDSNLRCDVSLHPLMEHTEGVSVYCDLCGLVISSVPIQIVVFCEPHGSGGDVVGVVEICPGCASVELSTIYCDKNNVEAIDGFRKRLSDAAARFRVNLERIMAT